MTADPAQRRLVVDQTDVGPCAVADTYLTRLRGLLGRRHVDGGLLLRECTSVHGLGMVIPLDVALLDDDLTVVATKRLRPFGMVLPRRRVRHVLEAERGAFARWGLRPGSSVRVVGLTGLLLAALLTQLLSGCTQGTHASVPGDTNPAFRATASPDPSLAPLATPPRDYRVVTGNGFSLDAPSAFQSSTQRSSNGEPMLMLRRPSSISELPATVAVVRESDPKQDVVEQTYALEVAKRTSTKATDLFRAEVTWPGAQRAVLMRWVENVPVGQGRLVPTRYVQLTVQVSPSLNLAVVAFAPDADADASGITTILRTFRTGSGG